MMTASVEYEASYSAFTLALLEDSGWYKANYQKAEPIIFGQGEGCEFIYKTCIHSVTKQARYAEFCSTSGQDACSFNHYLRGQCGVFEQDSSLYDYFGNSTSGHDSFADECPTVIGYSTGDCRDVTQSPKAYLPETYGSASRCFAGTLISDSKVFTERIYTGCLSI